MTNRVKKYSFRDLSFTPTGVFVLLHHLAALIGLPFYFYYAPPSWQMVVAAVILYFLTGMGITTGYHRMYAHRSFKLAKPVEAVFLFFATMAIQGQVIKWSNDHRLHHRYVDRDGDPYNVKKGLLYAHVLWIFDKSIRTDRDVVPDLRANKLAVFQSTYYLPLAIMSNTIVCLFVGWLLGDYLGAFVLCWGVRLLATYHATWFVNSLAHYWGEPSFSKELSARDNWIVALLTFGEGYHNYHHTFAVDYRNGIRVYHFDPVKWVIALLHKVGLVSERRQFDNEKIIDRLFTLDRELLLRRIDELSQRPRQLQELLSRRAFETRASFEAYITSLVESLKEKRTQIDRLMTERRQLKKKRVSKHSLTKYAAEIRQRRKEYAEDWKRWSDLLSMLLRQKMSRE